jgi:hypothetical protein
MRPVQSSAVPACINPAPAGAPLSPLARRLVLVVALALGLAAGTPRSAEPVEAADLVAQATTDAAPASPATEPAAPAAEPAAPAKEPASRSSRRAEVTIDSHGVIVDKDGRRVQIKGDAEFDSFDQFVERAPWLAGLVFLTLILLFTVPLLIVVLLIWYKIRKSRMQNETMIKLAEKGVVPAPEAMAALATPVPPGTPPSAVPLYEHARQLRKQAAWSDLRKGIVLGAVGLAFIFYSMINESSANWLGLICLFLGIGYGVLWYFEDRRAPARRDAGPPPAGGA